MQSSVGPHFTVDESRFPPTDYLLRYRLRATGLSQEPIIENTRFIHCRQCPTDLGIGLYDCEGWPGGISTSVSDGDAVYAGSRTRDLVPAGSTRIP
jgi:hypothetical protein